MTPTSPTPMLDVGARRLREIALSVEDGDRLGSEDELMKAVGVARATLRQIARLLEREGCLQVRRGVSGGYFAARPDLASVRSIVTGYLESLGIETENVTSASSALWVEVVRRATASCGDRTRSECAALIAKLARINDDASFLSVAAFEEENGRVLFALVGDRFIELVFQIGVSFTQARGYPEAVARLDGTPAHKEFLAGWRREKRLELEAMARGDVEMAVLAARRMRAIWHARIWDA